MIRIAQEDGSFIKISRKKNRKTGRKRGRPRKKKTLPPLPLGRKRPYCLILASNGKQKKTLKTFRTEEDAFQYLNDYINNNKVLFPVRHIRHYDDIIEANYELYILKHLTEYDIKDTVFLRNDYGEMVEYNTNSEKWQIIHKEKWEEEETFWVNGYDPTFQRKDFKWILENFIYSNDGDFYTFKNILIYKNKVIIDDNGVLNIVFCKNKSDSFRLYTEIENICIKNKSKYIMFSGDIGVFSRRTIGSWIDKLCDATGFNRKKIMRNSLRP